MSIPTCEINFVTLYRKPTMRHQIEDPKDLINELKCVDEEFEKCLSL